MEHPPGPRIFQSTRWSVVLLAGGDQGAASRQALAELCEIYWYPVYSFVRRRGSSHHDAMDLTQGFFTHLLEADALADLHPQKGRFRAFLLASIKNYLAKQWRTAHAMRRGGGMRQFSIDDAQFERRYQAQLADRSSPETTFERDWIQALLSRVLDRLHVDYARAGRTELFEALSPWLVACNNKVPQAKIGEQMGMSVPAVGMAVYRLRKRFAQLVREEVAQTVAEPADIEDEISRMLAVLG